MNSSFTTLQNVWAALIIKQLVRSGICHFFIAPGSRSTAICCAINDHAEAHYYTHIDERGLAFQALGFSKYTGKASAVVTTSGTAVANLLPAIVEASYSHIPVFVLTADRPMDLMGTGANQMIDHRYIFGDYCCDFLDLDCATESTSSVELSDMVAKLITSCLSFQRPVHLNVRFRTPFTPSAHTQDFSSYLDPLKSMDFSLDVGHGGVNVCKDFEWIDVLLNSKKGVIIVGDHPRYPDVGVLNRILSFFQWPIIADAGMGLSLTAATVLDYGPHVLKMMDEAAYPDVILFFGDHCVSDSVIQFIHDSSARVFHVCPFVRFSDPWDCHYVPLYCSYSELEKSLEEKHIKFESEMLTLYRRKSQTVSRILDSFFENEILFSDPLFIHQFSSQLQSTDCVFVSNSLPIRMVSGFARSESTVACLCSRGASGIDGILSTAVGMAYGAQRAITLLVGDIAFLHDLNGLLCTAKCSELSFTIIVINNQGGQIFNHLPVSNLNDVIDPLFVMPQLVSLESITQAFGYRYHCVNSIDQFTSVYEMRYDGNNPIVIEVSIDNDVSMGVLKKLDDMILNA